MLLILHMPSSPSSPHLIHTGQFCASLRQAAVDGSMVAEFTQSQVELMPWGEQHTYTPPDYESLIHYVCACEQQGLDLANAQMGMCVCGTCWKHGDDGEKWCVLHGTWNGAYGYMIMYDAHTPHTYMSPHAHTTHH